MRIDSNLLCSVQRRQSHSFSIFHGVKDLSCFQFSFFGVLFSSSFNESKKEGRVLGIEVTRFMSSHDKGVLDGLFVFKESEKNLIHSISELLDFLSSRNKGYLGVSFQFWGV